MKVGWLKNVKTQKIVLSNMHGSDTNFELKQEVKKRGQKEVRNIIIFLKSMFHVKPSCCCCFVFVVLHMTETKSGIQKLRYVFILFTTYISLEPYFSA